MKKGKFSVLMSIYIKENAEYFDQCMKSIFTQTVLPGEIVIVKDGAITQELEVVVEKYQNRYRDLIKIVPLPKNRGLGPALAEGILHCSYELIARMDTDDISRKDSMRKNNFQNLKKMQDWIFAVVTSRNLQNIPKTLWQKGKCH